MSVITTYLNDNAQIPLTRFVVYMLYSQLCKDQSDKSNRWSIGLSLSVASSAVGAISSSLSSTTLLIAVNGVPWRIFPQLHIKLDQGLQSTVVSMIQSICLSVRTSLKVHGQTLPIFMHVVRCRSSVLLWRRCGFIDGTMAYTKAARHRFQPAILAQW